MVKFLKAFPAIVVLGPRQVGKTTLVKLIAKNSKKKTVYLDLEKHSGLQTLPKFKTLAKLYQAPSISPTAFLHGKRLQILK